MVSACIFLEGKDPKSRKDGRGRHTKSREGFQAFFKKARLEGRLPRTYACGSGEDAYEDFCTALKNKKADFVILLVDSEKAVPPGITNWEYLEKKSNGRWKRPADTTHAQAHLMVQCMEAWFLADPESLKHHFGSKFPAENLSTTDVETISKTDLFVKIHSAVKKVKRDGYNKGTDSFKIIGNLDPDLVCKKSSHALQLIDELKKNL